MTPASVAPSRPRATLAVDGLTEAGQSSPIAMVTYFDNPKRPATLVDSVDKERVPVGAWEMPK